MSDSSDYATNVMPNQIARRKAWVEKARRAAVGVWASKGHVSADDIWLVCPPPDGVDPRVMGSVFHPKAHWRVLDTVKSARKVNHGRPIPRWAYIGPELRPAPPPLPSRVG